MESSSIVIVNWNTGSLLTKCLASLSALPEEKDIRYIIVVDNASHDDSFKRVQNASTDPRCIFLPQQENLGFAKANNIGIKYIHQHGGEHDHILLLNPDTEVRPHALEAMTDALQRNSEIGIAGPKLLEANGDVQQSVRRLPTLFIFVLLFLKLPRISNIFSVWRRYMMADFNYEQEQLVDQVMGAAFLIRNATINTVGLLDESFWIWFEEVDFCKRAQDAGWGTLYTPSATVVHYGGTSFNQLIGLARTKPFLHSCLVYTKKHLNIAAYGILVLLYPVALVLALVASLVHFQQRKNNNSRL